MSTIADEKLAERVRYALEMLRERAKACAGPSDITLAFTDAEDYPDFDNDPAANYDTGYIRGVAEALNMTVGDLLRAAQCS